tara:strand:- start:397 stop:513 length:117 start_codon:yes stop_codon:yes gene_type:complete
MNPTTVLVNDSSLQMDDSWTAQESKPEDERRGEDGPAD